VRIKPVDSATVSLDSPLRLNVAATLAFPDGSMNESGLRREARRGRLVIERIAGKDYTTLGNIQRMRELCRVQAKDPVFFSARSGATNRVASSTELSGVSSTDHMKKARDAAFMTLEELSKRSPGTSIESTSNKRNKGSVNRPTFPSPMSSPSMPET
jgi:hypothetical protein